MRDISSSGRVQVEICGRKFPTIFYCIINGGYDPNVVYHRLIDKAKTVHDIPRDLVQVHNARKTTMKVLLSRKDELINLHFIAMAMPTFVWKIETVPDLLLVLSDPELCREINKLWNFKPNGEPNKQLFYDSTFNIGDYFVSPLLTKLSAFQEEPTVPISILIHRNQTTESHTSHFLTMKLNSKDLLRKIVEPNIYITHDREDAITNSISFVFPDWIQFADFVHLKRNLKTHCKQEHVDKSILHEIIELMHNLQSSQSNDEFDDTYDNLIALCSEKLMKYIDENIKEPLKKISIFNMKSYGYLNDNFIANSNRCEGFNFMLKQLNEWKRRPVDAIVLAFQRLLAHFVIDIHRSRAGLGKYHLRINANRFTSDPDDINDEPKVSMNDVVKQLQNELFSLDNIAPNDDMNESTGIEGSHKELPSWNDNENVSTHSPSNFQHANTTSTINIDAGN
ncbi:unnamed protein product [Didymodactylos carnosus]|uniref:MULE transposase domain-containing protein n=1 Tax=Didymodactylos carnosus TaxID=1234261 RepID=A0A8S2EGQ6_9BILA|nr:unnamed protein product [Didymodactylos carnosus]CAF3945470.1 unnamed protein product [Didymodactylos carnosus]